MKRIVTVILGLLMIFSVAVFAGICYGARPVTVKLSFTAPKKGEQFKVGQKFICNGKLQVKPANTKLNQIHIWLFLIDRDGNLNRYLIQKPITLKNKGIFEGIVWEGTISPAKGTLQVAAVLADQNTDILFKKWVAKGPITKQYKLPRGTQILATVGVKTN